MSIIVNPSSITTSTKTNKVIYYGTCDSPTSSEIKIVTVPNLSGSLENGMVFAINFANGFEVDPTTTVMYQLKINDLDAVDILVGIDPVHNAVGGINERTTWIITEDSIGIFVYRKMDSNDEYLFDFVASNQWTYYAENVGQKTILKVNLNEEVYDWIDEKLNLQTITDTSSIKKENILYGIEDTDNKFLDLYTYLDGETYQIGASGMLAISDEEIANLFKTDTTVALENTYSKNIQKIGYWVDGSPVWRIAFSYELTENDLEDINDSWDLSIPIVWNKYMTDVNHFYIINWYAALQRFDIPCSIDDSTITNLDMFYFQFTSEQLENINDYKKIYGWIEFVCPEEYIITT